jgi:hypothetical protein
MHHFIVTSWVHCYGHVVAAQLLWHFIEPWDHCHFITGTIYLGAYLMSLCVVGSQDLSTQGPWNGLTHKLFDSFASSTCHPRAPYSHFGCRHYGQSSHLSMWMDGRDIKLVMVNGHGSTPLWRPYCSDMHTCILETPLPHCVRASLCS